jgi:hypothetical protein
VIGYAAYHTDPSKAANLPPSASDWADLAKLPDWGNIWIPKISDRDAQVKTNPPPWTPKAAATIAHQFDEERAGRPTPLFINRLHAR